jgi:hypothetical protein
VFVVFFSSAGLELSFLIGLPIGFERAVFFFASAMSVLRFISAIIFSIGYISVHLSVIASFFRNSDATSSQGLA